MARLLPAALTCAVLAACLAQRHFDGFSEERGRWRPGGHAAASERAIRPYRLPLQQDAFDPFSQYRPGDEAYFSPAYGPGEPPGYGPAVFAPPVRRRRPYHHHRPSVSNHFDDDHRDFDDNFHDEHRDFDGDSALNTVRQPGRSRRALSSGRAAALSLREPCSNIARCESRPLHAVGISDLGYEGSAESVKVIQSHSVAHQIANRWLHSSYKLYCGPLTTIALASSCPLRMRSRCARGALLMRALVVSGPQRLCGKPVHIPVLCPFPLGW